MVRECACIDCGRLSWADNRELNEERRDDLRSARQRVVDTLPVFCCGSSYRFPSTSNTDKYLTALMQSWECPYGFIRHREGLSPKEHYEMIDREQWEKNQETLAQSRHNENLRIAEASLTVARSSRTIAVWAVVAAFFGSAIAALIGIYTK